MHIIKRIFLFAPLFFSSVHNLFSQQLYLKDVPGVVKVAQNELQHLDPEDVFIHVLGMPHVLLPAKGEENGIRGEVIEAIIYKVIWEDYHDKEKKSLNGNMFQKMMDRISGRKTVSNENAGWSNEVKKLISIMIFAKPISPDQKCLQVLKENNMLTKKGSLKIFWRDFFKNFGSFVQDNEAPQIYCRLDSLKFSITSIGKSRVNVHKKKKIIEKLVPSVCVIPQGNGYKIQEKLREGRVPSPV